MKNPFKKLLLIWVLGFCVTFPFKASGADAYATLKNRAERAFAERSYQEAHEIYKSINLNELSPAERRWV
ncbi:MAG: hypothetical protein ACTHMT_07530, partial [Verrucomicrobiota bacterium]